VRDARRDIENIIADARVADDAGVCHAARCCLRVMSYVTLICAALDMPNTRHDVALLSARRCREAAQPTLTQRRRAMMHGERVDSARRYYLKIDDIIER